MGLCGAGVGKGAFMEFWLFVLIISTVIIFIKIFNLRRDLETHVAELKREIAELKAAAVDVVAEAAVARGYEYYAITDHSHYLREGRLHAQLEEIERARDRYPKLCILSGVEANIRASGEVDVADEDLALLDWVVASVPQPPATRPTGRLLGALQNPYVACVGHLTVRQVADRGHEPVPGHRRAGEDLVAAHTFFGKCAVHDASGSFFNGASSPFHKSSCAGFSSSPVITRWTIRPSVTARMSAINASGSQGLTTPSRIPCRILSAAARR